MRAFLVRLIARNKDAMAAWRECVAGATLTKPPTDMFRGDRYAVVTDPWGDMWSFATRLRDMTPEEKAVAAEAFFSEGPCEQ